MPGSLHAAVLKLHRWVGLTAGLAVFVIALTGCALVFEEDIDLVLNRHLSVVTAGPEACSLAAAVDAVRAAYPRHVPTSIVLPERPPLRKMTKT